MRLRKSAMRPCGHNTRTSRGCRESASSESAGEEPRNDAGNQVSRCRTFMWNRGHALKEVGEPRIRPQGFETGKNPDVVHERSTLRNPALEGGKRFVLPPQARVCGRHVYR